MTVPFLDKIIIWYNLSCMQNSQSKRKILLVRKYLSLTIIALAFTIPLIFSVTSILRGDIPFWYDNARDMLLAWDNLSKPTLIGPTSASEPYCQMILSEMKACRFSRS